MSLPFAVSAGVLAYEPFGPGYVATGAATGILCAVVGGVVGALARSPSFIVSSASVTMALIQSSFVSARLSALGESTGPALVLLPLSALLAGLCQVAFAWSGLARAVKFTPYPVVAGFLTGVSVLTLVQQFPKLFGEATMAGLLAHIESGDVDLAMALFSAGVLSFLFASERLAPRVPAILVGFVAGSLVWHALVQIWPDLPLGRTIGEVSIRKAAFGFSGGLEPLRAALMDAQAIQAVFLVAITIAILGTLDLTFAVRAAQNLSDIDGAPRRDLAGQGLANVASALAGGIGVTATISYTQTVFDSGGRTRIAAVAVPGVLLVAAFAAPSLISGIPVLILPAILIFIAWKLWDRWCVALAREALARQSGRARTRARRNAGIVAAVAVATVFGQPIVGALVGVVLSCLVFIIEMSRPIVRRRLDGSQVFSKRIRSQGDRAILMAQGKRIVVLDLQGVLFFGNADDLASEIKRMEGAASVLILDLRRVTDLDTSGATVVQQIVRRCREGEVRLMLAAADTTYRDLLAQTLGDHSGAALYPDLDAALEHAEDLILEGEGPGRGSAALRLYETDLGAGLSEAELAALGKRLSHCAYPSGTALCRAGEPADRLWLLIRGAVSVRVAGARHAQRIAGLGPGTAVGEMGLLDRRPRSADVVADEDVEALVLSAQDFDGLLREEPRLGQSLLATIARLTAQRLRATSDELRLTGA